MLRLLTIFSAKASSSDLPCGAVLYIWANFLKLVGERLTCLTASLSILGSCSSALQRLLPSLANLVGTTFKVPSGFRLGEQLIVKSKIKNRPSKYGLFFTLIPLVVLYNYGSYDVLL